jgi:CheY-like chemotaxis protein
MTTTSKKVLLVDDASTVLLAAQMMLKDEGWEILTASNGLQAVERAVADQPNLIVMDVVMPKMNGFEACRALKSNPATQRIPIILVTTRGEAENRDQGSSAGCNGYVTKPFHRTHLLQMIRTHLR